MSTSQQAQTFAEARADSYDLDGRYYAKSNLTSTYLKDDGLLVIPKMGPAGEPPSVVRVHAPYGVRTVAFHYAKDGGPPVFPAPASTTSGDTLLTAELKTPAPVELADGRLRFGIAGTYTYLQPGGGRGTEDTLPIDRHPFFSGVDMLGMTARSLYGAGGQGDYGTWNCGVVDMRYLASYGILG